MDDDQLDRIIDETARQMLDAEPGAGFRARVMERLETGRSSRPWIAIGAPVAIATVLIVALVVRDRPSIAPPDVLLVSRPIAASASVVGLESRALSAATASDARRTSAPPTLPVSEVAALAPEPLAVSSIVLHALESSESLQLPELEPIAPMAVAPLGGPEGERR